MISNASSKSITPNALPNMSGTILDWFQPLTFTRMTKTVVDFKLVESPSSVSFMGVIQPLSPQQLAMKESGQRAWIWKQIHALPDLVLNIDDVISFGSKSYRVMEKLDYTEYGYVEFHIVEDYTSDRP